MLFQRLYNWIKYKTLPSSFLFKNRLFLERDSKHRRIFSNFGLNFRSSKWSMYETYNIKTKSKLSFVNYFYTALLVFLFLIFLLNYHRFYITLNFFNNVAFFVWVIADSFDYYFSFFVWILTSLVSVFFNTIYSYFFFNNFSKKNDSIAFSSVFKKNLSDDRGSLSSSKEDLNLVFYSWITNPVSRKNIKLIESVFESSVNKKWWEKFYDLFPSLYSSLFKINQTSNIANFFDQKKGSLNSLNQFQLLNDSKNFLSFYDVVFFYNLKKNTNNFISSTPAHFLFSCWNINDSKFLSDDYAFLIKGKNGLFLLDNLNYSKLNYFFSNFREFWALNFFIKNQIDSAKWNRWLYRYSTLHRKILKTSHKITTSKRLISSGFFDNNLFNKNIWASENLSKFYNNNSLYSLLNLSYQNNSNPSLSNYVNFDYSGVLNSSSSGKISLLSFYENSYFWFLKRNYLLNNLSSNFINSGLKKNIKTNFDSADVKALSDSFLLEHQFSLHNLLSSNLNSASVLSRSGLGLTSKTDNSLYRAENFFLKDLQVFLNDADLLSKENTLLLSWIVSSTSTDFTNTYLSYLSSTNDAYHVALPSSFLPLNKSDSFDLRYNFFLSTLDINKLFLSEVFYKNLFN